MEHQYRSYSVESTSFLEDLNDPASCCYTAAHPNIQNNTNFTGHFQQQMPAYYGYESRFNVPQQQPVRYDPRMYTNPPLGYSNPGSQYDCSNNRQQLVAPRCGTYYERPEQGWRQNSSYVSQTYNVQPGDARLVRPHPHVNEVHPQTQNQFAYRAPNGQNLPPKAVGVPTYVNGSKDSVFQHSNQTQPSTQYHGLQTDPGCSYMHNADFKSIPKAAMQKEESNRICDRLSQLYRMSSTSPSVQQEIAFLQEKLRNLESSDMVPDKSSLQQFYAPQNCNDRIVDNAPHSSQMSFSQTSSIYQPPRYLGDPKLVCTNNSSSNLRLGFAPNDAINNPIESINSSACVVTCISSVPTTVPSTSYAYVAPHLQSSASNVSENFPVSTPCGYPTPQCPPANQTAASNSIPYCYDERTISTVNNAPPAPNQLGNVSDSNHITSSNNNNVNSCITTSCMSNFYPGTNVSNGFLESSVHQQGQDSLSSPSATLAQNNVTVPSSSNPPRNHQTFEDSQLKSGNVPHVPTCVVGNSEADISKMVCSTQSGVLGSVDTHSFPLTFENAQQTPHGSTIHYRQANESQQLESVPDTSYSLFRKNVSESSCNDSLPITPVSFSQSYQNYGQYVSLSQDSRPSMSVASHWNQHYQSSLNTNQGITGEINGQHLQTIAPAPPSHSIVVSCVQMPGTQCIEMSKFSGLAGSDVSYTPILPKPADLQPVKKTRGRKPLNRGNETDKQRQQKQRKGHEAETTAKEDQSDTTPDRSVFATPTAKRPRGRAPKKPKIDTETTINIAPDPFAIEGVDDTSDTKADESPASDCRKRRASMRPVEVRKKRKYRKSLKFSSDLVNESSSTLQSPELTSPDSTNATETVTKVKVVRARPRPKKRRPLPTLIRRKKRSAFYGDDSGSEPEVSGRAASRVSEVRLQSTGVHDANSKRRSERHTGDRKSYTDDLDLNLTDDETDRQDGEMITLNDTTDVAEDVDNKVVEAVLGRRITKRLVKKITQTEIKSTEDKESQNPLNTSEKNSQITVTEEEEEEEVEEFYLKYKSYSYLHCEWRALDEINDPRILPKIRRFEMRQANSARTEDDDVVLFNPDYVEVERVLDVKVYSNGHLVSTDRLESNGDSQDLRKYTKRPKERNKLRSVREEKNKMKNETVSGDMTASLTTNNTQESVSEIHSTTPLTDDFGDSETNSQCPGQPSNTDEKVADGNQKTDLEVDSKSADTVCPSPSEQTLSTGEQQDQLADKTDENTPPPALKECETDNSPLETSVLSSSNKVEKDDEIDHHKDEDEDDEGTSSPVNVTYYLVKWRSLAYEDATWEMSQDVDPAKVKEFHKRRYPPKNFVVPRDSDYKIIRPDPTTWKPIDSSTIYKNNNKLRDYQVEGVNWLTFCWYHHRNCILADEMGLGKTVQSVTFLLEIFKANVQGPFLVIVPLSTVGNWQREFENWSDLNVIIYHGSSVSRSMIQQYEMFYRKRSSGAPRHDVYKFHAVVTTFEVLMNDIEFFGQIHWAAAVIDEAHRLKNKKCKLGEGLRYLDLDHRVLLTGTPLQNNVEELFGLLNFLEPEKFNCSATFVAEYGELKTEEQVERLKTVLKPMMLRRLKEDVEKSLAPKEETVVEVELTNIQKKYYRAIMERNFSFLCKGSSTNAPNLMNIMMELRKCCNHPFLIKGAEDAILSEAQSNENAINEDDLTFQTMVYASGKLVLIHKLLPKLRADGHKVLIFSQMIRVLDILEDYLVHQGFQFERIDGRIHGPLRQEAIDRFSVDPDKFVFLLCTKAGGLGINLTAADVVIIYDSDWNPQNDLQAQARCHRIGQQKMVKVYRLITRNTYEREMFDRASLKLGLDRAVLQSMGSKEARQAQMSKKEIEDLLKKGAYGALMDDDKAGEDFCEEDIDQILQSRARIVQLEQGKENSTFSKATFSMSDNRSDIALDDPNFWQKWAKKAGVDETALAMKDLIVQTPRQRRQTTRYSSIMVSEPPNIPSPASFDMSDFDDNANSNSSGDETVIHSSSGRGRSRRNRKSFRHSRKQQNTPVLKQEKSSTIKECDTSAANEPNLIEPLDRADLFRVERCLLTWSWGQWEQAVAGVSFKRSMQPSELAYFSCALLDYTLHCLPSNSDVRARAICETLARPGTWKLDIHQVNIAVSEATSKIKCLPPTTALNIECENFDGPISTVAQNIDDDLSEGKKQTDLALPPSEIVSDIKRGLDSPVLSEYNATGSPAADDIALTDPAASLAEKSTPDDPDQLDDKVEITLPIHSESCELVGKSELADKDEDEIDEESHIKVEGTQISPRLAAFKPELLLPSESFKKHVQRAGSRLLNRVALLFFLQCDIIGIKAAEDLVASRLSHTDFIELASSLPPLEALDSDLPAPWWDSCCDKCLLLGIMKHGWEKYTAMRLDPKLCFRSRAIEIVQSQASAVQDGLNNNSKVTKEADDNSDCNQETKVDCNGVQDSAECESADNAHSILKPAPVPLESLSPNAETAINEADSITMDNDNLSCSSNKVCESLKKDLSSTPNDDESQFTDDVLLSLPFPQVADLNSRTRKLVGFFQRVKSQLETDSSRHLPKIEVEESVVCPPVVRVTEAKVLKWTRREEADFYRVVSSFGVEFDEIPSDTSAHAIANEDNDAVEGKTEENDKEEKEEEDEKGEKDKFKSEHQNADVMAKPCKPLPRIYRWTNFRQLANLSRKSDQALVEYFHSFYRMCQRVCKKELTEFAEPASTIATTTTSGSSDLGCEIIIDPISEERASRCLSRIDLLVRIRNHILKHPQLEERIKLCQPSSDLPGWWIPGKHDKELLFAAAKHGLARTDLNILQDSDSSFSRIVQLIRDKLTHDPVVTDYPGDLIANQVTRTGIAAAAASAARAAAFQLMNEGNSSPTDASSASTSLSDGNVNKTDLTDKLKATDKSGIQPTIDSSTLCESISVEEEKKPDSEAPEFAVLNDAVATIPSTVVNTESGDTPLDTDNIVLEKSDVKVTGKEDQSEASLAGGLSGTDVNKVGQESAAAEWSIKFATNLAISWPKDRTVQHRLELICQTIENNEWPNPRRFITPITTAIPVSSSMIGSTRAQIETKVSCLSDTLPQNFQSLPLPRDAYSLSSNNSRRIPLNTAHIPLSRKQYGLPVYSSEMASNPLSVESTCDVQSSSLTQLSSLSNNELDDSLQFDFSLPGGHINSVQCKPSLQAYDSEAQFSTATNIDSSECISTSVNIPLDLKDNQLPFPSNPTNEISLTDRSRGKTRNRSNRTNSFGKNLSVNRDKSGSNFDSEQDQSSLSDNLLKCTTSHSENFVPGSKAKPISTPITLPEDIEFSMPPPSVTSAPRSAVSANNRGRKRKNESSKNQSDTNLPFSKGANSSKRERLHSLKSDPNDIQKTPQNADIWDVRVPVISLIDGSLIYGDQAPERRSLESWLDANPNYMPYSVELEDRAIYNRVASARGQDTSNMESLAYKHYLNSLLVNAAAGLHGTNNNNNLATSSSQSSANTQVNNFNTQQYLQQQQLLSTFGAYARHPAYASLIASALNNWPSIPIPSTASPAVTNSVSSTKSRVSATTSGSASSTSRSSKSRSNGNRSENSNRRRDCSELTDSSSLSSQAYSSFMPERNSNHNPIAQDNPFQMSTGNQRVDSMLAAVYQQAAAMNLAYMCNPLTAAALYSQIMLSCSGAPNTPDVGLPNINLASNATHQATLASLYANYLLSAKQMQQRQVSQSPGQWDTQQLLSSLAATLASACGGGTGEIDTAALLSMFGGAANISPTIGTTSTPLKHSSTQRRPCSQSIKRTHTITTSPPPASDLNSSVGSERETQDSGDIRQTVSCRHSDQSQDNYDTTTKEYDESQSILDLSK